MVEYIKSKTIVTYTKNDFWFGCDFNMNIYKGCNHGCIYCDSRSDCYKIIDFDKIKVKQNALEIIRNDLRSKNRYGVIGTGAMSDPYNYLEKELLLTRNALELINAYEFGVSIATKSDLIIRDIDVLKDIKTHSPVIVQLTITTADDKLAKIIEPNVINSSKRFETLKQLNDNDIYCGILLMPILPFINDTEQNILEIVRKAKENGAKFIYPYFGVTLRSNQKEYYYQKLDKYFPNLKDKYISYYDNKYKCNSPNSRHLATIFRKECKKLGILYKMEDIIKDYKKGYSRILFH